MNYGWEKCMHKMKVKDVISTFRSMSFDGALIIKLQGKSNLIKILESCWIWFYRKKPPTFISLVGIVELCIN